MKRMLTFLADLFGNRARRRRDAYHDDALRANQSDGGAAFSYWRSLVS